MATPVERLIRLRKILGLSQRELAAEFNVSAGAVGSWEVGDHEIPGPVLKLIEFYEKEFFTGGSTNLFVEREPMAEQLVSTLQNTMVLKDSQLLARLRAATVDYLNCYSDHSEQKRRLHALALKKLISTLGDSRGLPMKVAQIVAFLDPEIPQALRDIFESLQTHGSSMAFKTVQQIVEDELDSKLEDLFLEFSRRPIAAASIGQVHRAKLRDGTVVAVKVQYPDIQKKCVENFGDLEFVHQLCLFVGNENADIHELIRDFHQTILLECDFELEAEMQEKFIEVFSADKNIIIPKVFLSHSRKHVLTTQWIDGISWREFKSAAAQEEKDRAARTISRFYAQAGFAHGLIQADPHPGNYLFCENARVAFLDFGRVKELDIETKGELRSLHELILSKDKEKTKSFIEKSSFFRLGSSFDFEIFWNALAQMSWHLQFDGAVAISKELLSEQRKILKNLSRTLSITISPEFFWLMLFVHPLLIAGRVDLEAVGNWREVLKTNM